MSKRRKYSPKFKQGAVVLMRQSSVSTGQVARELGAEHNTLARWEKEAEHSGIRAFKGTGNPRDEELASLKRELARVKKERDFLCEAATFFARGSS